MDKKIETPFYQKICFNLISLAIISLALFYASDILLPLLFSILLASLLLPVTRFLARKRLNRSLSILIPLTVSIVIGVGIVYFLSSQVINFMDDVPTLKERITEISDSFQQWVRDNTRMTIRKQNQYFDDTVEDLKEKAPQLVGQTFVSLTSVLVYAIFLLLYTFLILFHRSNIKAFLISLFKNGSEERVQEVLTESTTIAQQYLYCWQPYST